MTSNRSHILTMVGIVVFVLAAMLWVVHAAAAPGCTETAQITKMLKDKYGEVVQVTGTGMLGTQMKLWANPKTGTWTITFEGNRSMCVMGEGVDFKLVIQGKDI